MSYRPHDAFVAPARPRSEPWRVAVGYVLIMAAELGLVYVLFAFVAGVIGQDLAFSAFEAIFTNAVTSRDTLLMLGAFVLLILGVCAVTLQLHRRSPLTLIGPLPQALRDFRAVVRALALLMLLVTVLLPETDPLQRNMAVSQWLLWLPLALPVLLIQTGAEELLFRGYLQQQLAARGTPVLIWMGLPSLLFAWGHYVPSASGENAVMIAGWAFVFAMAAADLTARTGTLGAAVALHFANNAVAILYTAVAGHGSGLALYVYDVTLDTPFSGPEIAVEYAMIGVMWLTARLALRV